MDLALIGDWLSREGGALLAWWLLTTLAGALVWPLLYRILGGLPDRGYTLARAAGLMLTAFVFWFLGSVGLLRNTPGGAAFAWLAVGAISVAAYLRWPGRAPLRPWLREHRALIITAEVLFAALFFGWSLFRRTTRRCTAPRSRWRSCSSTASAPATPSRRTTPGWPGTRSATTTSAI